MPRDPRFQDGDGAQALHWNETRSRWEGYAVESGCDVVINTGDLGSGNNTLTVQSGTVIVDGSEVSVSSQSVDIAASDDDPRKDLVVYDESQSAIAVKEGTPEPAEPRNATGLATRRPAPRDLSGEDAVALKEVWVPANATNIGSGDLTDRRLFATRKAVHTEQLSVTSDFNEIEYRVDPTASDIQSIINGFDSKGTHTLITTTTDKLSVGSAITINKTDVRWIHHGQINISGNNLLDIGADDSDPARTYFRCTGSIVGTSSTTTNNGEVVIRIVSGSGGRYVTGPITQVKDAVAFDPNAQGSTSNYQSNYFDLANVTNTFRHGWFIPTEPSNVLMEGNEMVVRAAVNCADTCVQMNGGQWNTFTGDTHPDETEAPNAPGIDDHSSKGENRFTVKFSQNRPRLHPASTYNGTRWGDRPKYRPWRPGSGVTEHFRSLDGLITVTDSGTNVSLGGREITLTTGTTSGNQAKAFDRWSSSTGGWNFSTFDRSRILRASVNFGDTSGPLYVLTGDITNQHIGVKMASGDLVGIANDGSNETTTTLISGASTGAKRLFIDYQKSQRVDFYTDKDTHQGSITTNLPSGSSAADIPWLLVAESDGTDRTLECDEIMVGETAQS